MWSFPEVEVTACRRDWLSDGDALTWPATDTAGGAPAGGPGPVTARRYPRSARVNEILREVLADALERLADTDDRLGLLTVTGVDCDPDLRHALVLFSSLR